MRRDKKYSMFRPLVSFWRKRLDLKAKKGQANQIHCAVSNKNGLASPEFDYSGVGDPTHDGEEKLVDIVGSIPMTCSTQEPEPFENDLVFYLDFEPELPELVACCRENIDPFVKDIFIDDIFPSKERFFFDVDGVENLCSLLMPNKIGSKNEFSVKCNSMELMPIGEVEVEHVALEEFANAASEELLSVPEMSAVLSHSESNQQSQWPSKKTISSKICAHEKSENVNGEEYLVSPTAASVFDKSIPQTLCPDCEAKTSNHGHDVALSQSLPDPEIEGSENNVKNKTWKSHNIDEESEFFSKIEDEVYVSKLEAKSITFEFKTSPATTSGAGDGSQSSGSEHPETRNSSVPEYIGSQSCCSRPHGDIGELSFSAAFPLTSRNSGQIAHSGRSDSSRNSKGSFAFPVLHSEWNSTPVRTPKAYQEHAEKRRSWRWQSLSLLCCRF